MSVNKLILVGHVGKDPEIKTVGESKVANFSLATSESYTKNGEKVTQTEWHNIQAWNKLADLCEKHVKKGQELYVEGSVRTRSYEGTDGVKKYITEVPAIAIKFVGKKEEPAKIQNEPEISDGNKSPGQNMADQKNDDTDLPF